MSSRIDQVEERLSISCCDETSSAAGLDNWLDTYLVGAAQCRQLGTHAAWTCIQGARAHKSLSPQCRCDKVTKVIARAAVPLIVASYWPPAGRSPVKVP
jgi:hypothetical protein